MDAQDTATATRRRSRPAIAVAVFVLLAAGLAAAVAIVVLGSGRPTATPVRSVISDVRSADPCSAISTAAFAGFGEVVVLPDTGTFAGCVAEIRSGGTPLFSLNVELLNEPETEQYIGPAPWDGFRPVVAGDDADADFCQRYVLLPDRNSVQFSIGGDGSQATCPVADAGAHAAAAALSQHPIGTRRPLDASTTFGGPDACALLNPVAPAFVGGSGPGLSGYGGWACHWRGTLADVVLDFFRYPPPGDAEFEAFTVGGRAGMTRELGAICRVYVPQRTLPAADGSARTEYVRISVHGGRDADRCARASGVGERVVAALPPQR